MAEMFTARSSAATVPITPLTPDALGTWAESQPAGVAAWVASTGFKAAEHAVRLVPGEGGRLGRVLLGVEDVGDMWAYGALPGKLPKGRYRIDADLPAAAATAAALGWALGSYAFTRYKARKKTPRSLVWPRRADRDHVSHTAEATTLVRDLINTPANDMGPAELAAAARALARTHGARLTVTTGAALLRRNYPAIHAVGRASDRAPRLIDLRWGAPRHARVSLVGKGVCFDSGGLDLKGAGNMLLMKKDMGGAAQTLGLASMIMAAKLPVRLRVLIPAVENSVSGAAFRPLDVLATRKGLTVEVGNTDAEGRLVLADALAEADREKPALIVDCATLTGAARVALGPDLPALFSNNDAVADQLLACGTAADDPLWRLPLWQPYRKNLESKVADLNNVSSGPFAGAVTAALFLEHFVSPETPWVHIDLMAWHPVARPGRPVGGDAMGMRALYRLIAASFGTARQRAR